MSRSSSALMTNPQMQRYEPVVFEYMFQNTTATCTQLSAQIGYPAFIGSANTDFTQALIDSFLGTTSEFAVTTAFGATAMGANSFGFVLDLRGGARSAQWATLTICAATSTVVGVGGNGETTTVLPDTLTSGLAVTTGGNVYGRLVGGGFDAATAVCLLRVAVLLK